MVVEMDSWAVADTLDWTVERIGSFVHHLRLIGINKKIKIPDSNNLKLRAYSFLDFLSAKT